MENTTENQVIVSCLKCGHEHKYETLEALEKVPLATPCNGCGYLFVQRMAQKMDIMMDMLQKDPKAIALLQAGKYTEFSEYLEEKVRK
jgi:Zn ribbon nucleic-acid-binding protein